MEDNSNGKTAKTSQPTHYAYQVSGKDEHRYWTRIGAAWAHRDGNGFSIQFNCMPLDGQISLRMPSNQ